MKTMIRSVCAVAAVAVLAGCGVPKDQYQKLVDEKQGIESQLNEARIALKTQQDALQAKDAEISTANAQVQKMMVLLSEKEKALNSLKLPKPTGGSKATPKTTSKGKSTAK